MIMNTLNEYAEVVSRSCEKKYEMIFFSYATLFSELDSLSSLID